MTNIPRNEYPRPQYRREDWKNLNGTWSFSFDDDNIGEQEKWYNKTELGTEITVPFAFESQASGIGDRDYHPQVWYQRQVKVSKDYKGKRVLLNFQAVDYLAKIWINGEFVGSHKGGYTSFSFDITDFVSFEKTNNIVVKAQDTLSCMQPRGKQGWKKENFGCWYTRTTGIWQTVWLEYVSDIRLSNVKMTPDLDEGSVGFEYNLNKYSSSCELELKTIISFKGERIQSFRFILNSDYQNIKVKIMKEAPHDILVWTPGNPNLYDVRFELYKDGNLVDSIDSYFGMRKITTQNGNVVLNTSPIYQRLILDQGYWEESILTPPSDEAIKKDIELIKKMGFNGVRKHQKIEDSRFYYWCDKLGLLVWAEMPSTYEFSDKAVNNFSKEWLDIVDQKYNHPSIITWVPFNESWGVVHIKTNKKEQSFTEGIYHLTKTKDPMRPVIVNDGWEHTISDIVTLHDYAEDGDSLEGRYKDKEKIEKNLIAHNGFKFPFADGFQSHGQPIQISEFGGIAFDDGEGWGYGNKVKGKEDFIKRFKSLINCVENMKYVSGYCYTQLTDVEQEVNGLLNPAREPKIAIDKIREIISTK